MYFSFQIIRTLIKKFMVEYKNEWKNLFRRRYNAAEETPLLKDKTTKYSAVTVQI